MSDTDGDETAPEADSSSGLGKNATMFCLVVGLLLLVGGGGLITISGLGVDMDIPGNRLARGTAVFAGALLLLVYFELAKERFPETPIRRLFQGGILAMAITLAAVIVADNQPPLVPDMAGLTEQNAQRMLAFLGIEVRGITPVSNDAPSQQVVGQDIDPGDRSRDIVLEVSLGPDLPVLIDVVGLGQEAAIRLLTDEGVSVTLQFVDGGSTAGRVTGMRPAPRTRSASAVLEVATGAAQVEMPDVVGLSQAEASDLLSSLGIESELVSVEDPAPVDEVVAQEPLEGTPTGGARLTVSAGPGLPVVPDVRHLTVEAARTALSEAVISVTEVRESSVDVPEGTVISQDPAPDERSASIELTVSDGPENASFLGSWANVDSETGGMTRMVVTESGDSLVMQGFGSCTPNDCDWGLTPATVTSDGLHAEFTFSFKTTTIDVVRAGPLLIADVHDDYDAAGRDDRRSTYTFSMDDPALLDVDRLDLVTRGPLIDDLISSGAIDFLPQLTPGIEFESLATG